jgi:hypothetical protein
LCAAGDERIIDTTIDAIGTNVPAPAPAPVAPADVVDGSSPADAKATSNALTVHVAWAAVAAVIGSMSVRSH